jgi:hypothetical protein
MSYKETRAKPAGVRASAGVLVVTLLVGVLFTAFLACWWPTQNSIETQWLPLKARLPDAYPGWTCEDSRVAETPAMRRAVERNLAYDDALVRTFRRDEANIAIYMAYWRPGKMPPHLIGLHIPDICWVGVGWTMVKLRPLILQWPQYGRFQPAEYRQFSNKGAMQYVAYWHLVGGRRWAEPGASASEMEAVREYIKTEMGRGREEQYFIRISSVEPLEALMASDSPLPLILSKLAAVGLISDATVAPYAVAGAKPLDNAPHK